RVTPALRDHRALLERPARKEIPEQLAPQVHKEHRVRKETPALLVRRERRGHKVHRATPALKARRVLREQTVRKVCQGCKGHLDLRDLLGRAAAVLMDFRNLLKVKRSLFPQALHISSWRCGGREVAGVAPPAAAQAPLRSRRVAEAEAGAIPVQLF